MWLYVCVCVHACMRVCLCMYFCKYVCMCVCILVPVCISVFLPAAPTISNRASSPMVNRKHLDTPQLIFICYQPHCCAQLNPPTSSCWPHLCPHTLCKSVNSNVLSYHAPISMFSHFCPICAPHLQMWIKVSTHLTPAHGSLMGHSLLASYNCENSYTTFL